MEETSVLWYGADLIAIDVEGSGAQDGEDEALLEVAVVPLATGRPRVNEAFTSVVNPQRRIARRPWLAPGLTNDVLQAAPTLAMTEPGLARIVNGRHLVGHNVAVDWRLLHRLCPSLKPVGLIDTLRLARTVDTGSAKSLTALLDRLDLTSAVQAAAPDSQPHRALWDATGAALLLSALIALRWREDPTFVELCAVASPEAGALPGCRGARQHDGQQALF